MTTDDERRLEELQDHIDEVRRRAQEHGTLPDGEPVRSLADPDGDGDVDPYRVETGG